MNYDMIAQYFNSYSGQLYNAVGFTPVLEIDCTCECYLGPDEVIIHVRIKGAQ